MILADIVPDGDFNAMGKEIWKPIKSYNADYFVSSYGRIKSMKKNKQGILKQQIDKNGYKRITLYWFGKFKSYFVHRIVLESFVENTENKKTVNHINGIKDDNRLHNLEWATHSENILHSNRIIKTAINRCGEDHQNSKLSNYIVIKMREDYKNNKKIGEISQKYNIERSLVGHIIHRRAWKHI
jgi:hypothetical protein